MKTPVSSFRSHYKAVMRAYRLAFKGDIMALDACAIRQGSPSDYWQAMHNASQARIDHARTALGLDLIQYNGGEWIQYLSADA